MSFQKLFKPYIVKRKNGQCQVLIPLIELDELCEAIELHAFHVYKPLFDKDKCSEVKDCKLTIPEVFDELAEAVGEYKMPEGGIKR